jgi:hypothetical protein
MSGHGAMQTSRSSADYRTSKDETDISSVAGNVSDNVKRWLLYPRWLKDPDLPTQSFAQEIFAAMRVTEATVLENSNEPKRKECRIVYNITVTQSAFLLTTLPIAANAHWPS